MNALVVDAHWDPRSEDHSLGEDSTARKATDASVAWRNPELRMTDRERPSPDDEEVLVRVKYAGICGSDVSMLETDDDGYVHYSAYLGLPNVIGHEFSGEVVETGANTNLFESGDLVTAEVTDYCGRCSMCRQGFNGHCENFEQLGFTVPGAFSEYVAVPEKLCWDVSALEDAYPTKEETLKAAATIEPSTITYYGLFGRADGVVPGDYHVYHGTGPIGLTGMNVSRAAGAGKVIAFEPSNERRAVARELGFDHVYDPTECDPVETITSVTNGDGADVHLETAGAVEETYAVIDQTLAEGANVIHISNATADPEITLRNYQGSGAQLYGSEGHTGQQTYPRVIRLMANGRLDNLPIVTSVYPLSDAEEAMERARRRVDGKVLLEI